MYTQNYRITLYVIITLTMPALFPMEMAPEDEGESAAKRTQVDPAEPPTFLLVGTRPVPADQVPPNAAGTSHPFIFRTDEIPEALADMQRRLTAEYLQLPPNTVYWTPAAARAFVERITTSMDHGRGRDGHMASFMKHVRENPNCPCSTGIEGCPQLKRNATQRFSQVLRHTLQQVGLTYTGECNDDTPLPLIAWVVCAEVDAHWCASSQTLTYGVSAVELLITELVKSELPHKVNRMAPLRAMNPDLPYKRMGLNATAIGHRMKGKNVAKYEKLIANLKRRVSQGSPLLVFPAQWNPLPEEPKA